MKTKAKILEEIKEKFYSLNVPAVYGTISDIVLIGETCNTNQGIKTKYEIIILLNEKKSAAYMYYKVSEASGLILERRMSAPIVDGGEIWNNPRKKSNIETENNKQEGLLDLYEIMNIASAIRKIVKKNGWKFKPTKSKKKATYSII